MSETLSAQIGFPDVIIIQQFRTGAGRDDLAGFQNISPVSDRKRHLGVLFNQKDRPSGGGHFRDGREELGSHNPR